MLTDELVRTRFRYNTAAALDTREELRQKGLLVEDNASPPLVELIELADEILHATATNCWRSAEATATVSAGAEQILARATGPLVDPYLELPEPEEPAPRLLYRLVGLRYARADAHAAAWMYAGLEAESIVALTKAWQGDPVEAPALVVSGLVADDGKVTARGQRARDDIEQDTNGRMEPAFASLGGDEWTAWLDALAAL